jgi:hypothetical protein
MRKILAYTVKILFQYIPVAFACIVFSPIILFMLLLGVYDWAENYIKYPPTEATP